MARWLGKAREGPYARRLSTRLRGVGRAWNGMMELESLLPVGMVALALAIGWVVAGTFRHSNSTLEVVASWLAYSTIVFLIGGGLAMFGVVLLLFFVGTEAAQAGLAVAVVLLLLSPALVAATMTLRRRAARRTRSPR